MITAGAEKTHFEFLQSSQQAIIVAVQGAQQYIPLGEEPPRDVPLMSWWCGDCEHGRSIRWL